MGDRLRLVDFPYRGSRPREILDLNDGDTYALIRDTLTPAPGAKKQQFSQQAKRYGGQTLTQEIHENGSVSAEWYINSTTQDLAIAAQETMLQAIERVSGPQRYIEWKPENATYPVFFECRAGLPWEPMYRWIETVQTRALHLKAGFAVAPLALGHTMFMRDEFDVDSISDWDEPVANAISELTISGGELKANATGDVTQRYTLTNQRSGYTLEDAEVTVRGHAGASFNGFVVGATLKHYKVGSNNWAIQVYVTHDGANAMLKIDKLVANTRTELQSTTITGWSSAVPFYVRGRIERGHVYAEYFSGTDVPDKTFVNSGFHATHPMTAAELLLFGPGIRGQYGIAFRPKQLSGTQEAVEWWEVRPHTFQRSTTGPSFNMLPSNFALPGIPGTAPAKCDVRIRTANTGALPAVFGSVGWCPKPGLNNYVWNGDLEGNNTYGWNAAAVAGVSTAAASITTVTTQAKYGAYTLSFNTNAVADSGVTFPIYKLFKKGQRYQARVWTYTGGSIPYRLSLGVSGSRADTTWTQVSAGWVEHTVTWTPTVDTPVAYFALVQTDATARTLIYADGATVYEYAGPDAGSTLLLTSDAQLEGRGAHVPFGIIEAEAHDWSSPGITGATADANAHAGWRQDSPAGVGGAVPTFYMDFLIDPSLLDPVDYSQDSIDVEVWARAFVNYVADMSVRATLSYFPEGSSVQRYTLEYGALGKTLPVVNSTANYRLIRLGTITLPIREATPGRWKLRLQYDVVSTAAVSIGTDYLMLLPIQTRASSPTGKSPDSTYPKLFNSVADITKRIESDLRGEYLRYNPNGSLSQYPDQGLGGSLISLPPGDCEAFVKLSSVVPDDPRVISTGSEQLEHSTVVAFDVTPRYHLLRGS